MRLDKYLKVSRLIKRRTLAKEATEADRILLNGSPAKPSKEVKVGDHLTISYGKRVVEVKITSLRRKRMILSCMNSLVKLLADKELVIR